MKYLFVIVVVYLMITANAAPSPSSYQNLHSYLRCVPQAIDDLANEFDCQDIWQKHRITYLDTVYEFEECVQESADKIDE